MASSTAYQNPLVELKIYDIRASSLPKVKKALYIERKVRIVCQVATNNGLVLGGKTGWGKRNKRNTEETEWMGEGITFITRKSAIVSFEIYAEHQTTDDQKLDLQMETFSVDGVLNRTQGNSGISLSIASTSSPASLQCSVIARLVDTGTVQNVKDEVETEASQRQKLLGVRETFKTILSLGTAVAELDTFAKTGFACVNVLVSVLDKPFQTDESVGKLLDSIQATLKRVVDGEFYVTQHLSDDQRQTSTLMMRQINECLAFINTYTRQSYWNITVKSIFKNYVTIIEGFVANMDKMNAEYDLDGKIVTEARVYRVANTVGDIDKRMELNALKIADGADYNPEKACLNDTRVDILQSLRMWINGSSEQAKARAFLLLGQAGVGKSAIAHTIAKEWKLAERLGASFCFSKDRGIDHFFRTLARRLADLDPAYASRLATAISRDSSLKTTPVPSVQLQELLLKPFQSLSILGTIIIVIDALDECKVDRDNLIQLLNDHIDQFPSNIRFIITSRPSEAEMLQGLPWVTVHSLEADDATQNDIRTFVEHQLRHRISRKPLEGFGAEEFSAIVTASQGVFQYATVVCKEIMDAAAGHWELPSVAYTRLVTEGSQGLDSLYLTILTHAYRISMESPPSAVATRQLGHFHRVLGWILNSKGRISLQILFDLDHVLDATSAGSSRVHGSSISTAYGPVAGVLRPLGALLSGTQEPAGTVYPLHSSFRDFLVTESRSHQFYIGPEPIHHATLALVSLKVMNRDLHFNMANLENSYVPNDLVPEFDSRVSKGVSRTLAYSCSNWAKHLKEARMAPEDFAEVTLVHRILEHLFLFWVEALALEKKTIEAQSACQFLQKWIETPIVTDRLGFLHNFSHLAEEITPHLYISGIPFWPLTGGDIVGQFCNLVQIPKYWEMSKTVFLGAMYGHAGRVNSAVFSPERRHVLSGGLDGIILWDVMSGTQIGQTLTEHGNEINSVAFSPDGKSFVSTSQDKTMRIWSSETRRQIGDPVDHGDWVQSALFSPDGAKIVSACHDGCIRLWDVQSRKQIWKSHLGPYATARAASFSPDGSRIVSASSGHNATMIWDTATGTQIGQDLKPGSSATTNPNSAAYSPDGSYIISGAVDCAIHIWDAETGEKACEPMAGHVYGMAGWVGSAEFSPDGKLILSASGDWTVRLWDAHTHEQLGQPLRHASAVMSASFSSDGQLMVSASSDKTVRIWDVQKELGREVQHARNVFHQSDNVSAVFSRDGKHVLVASNGNERALHIFDASTGSLSEEHSTILSKWQPPARYTSYTSAHFSTDNALILSTTQNSCISIHNARSGSQIGEDIYGGRGQNSSLTSAMFSLDSTKILAAYSSIPYLGDETSAENRIMILDVQSGSQVGEVITVLDNKKGLKKAVFSPDGTRILGASADNVVRIWDTESRMQLEQLCTGHLIVFSADGGFMASLESDNTTVHLYNADTFEHLLQFSTSSSALEKEKQFTVITVSFSPSSLHIIAACTDNALRVYSTLNGRQIGDKLTGHRTRIMSVEFSPVDGTQIVSSGNNEVRLWTFRPDFTSSSNTNAWLTPGLFDKQTGWIIGSHHERLLWIPPPCRQDDAESPLWLPYHLRVLGASTPELRVRWENSLHGTDWTRIG